MCRPTSAAQQTARLPLRCLRGRSYLPHPHTPRPLRAHDAATTSCPPPTWPHPPRAWAPSSPHAAPTRVSGVPVVCVRQRLAWLHACPRAACLVSSPTPCLPPPPITCPPHAPPPNSGPLSPQQPRPPRPSLPPQPALPPPPAQPWPLPPLPATWPPRGVPPAPPPPAARQRGRAPTASSTAPPAEPAPGRSPSPPRVGWAYVCWGWGWGQVLEGTCACGCAPHGCGELPCG